MVSFLRLVWRMLWNCSVVDSRRVYFGILWIVRPVNRLYVCSGVISSRVRISLLCSIFIILLRRIGSHKYSSQLKYINLPH